MNSTILEAITDPRSGDYDDGQGMVHCLAYTKEGPIEIGGYNIHIATTKEQRNHISREIWSRFVQ